MKIFPENFKSSELFVVREILTKPPNKKALKGLDCRWEEEHYHDALYQQQLAEQAEYQDQQNI